MTDEGLMHLSNLYKLNISNCFDITDKRLKYLSNLHTLNIRRCNK